MALKEILKRIELFNGLTDLELDAIAAVCQEKRFDRGDLVAEQGAPGDVFYIITVGFVEILLTEPGSQSEKALVNLGSGQTVGEMSLIDQGPRSATVRALSAPTVVQMIERRDFEELCRQDAHIGYIVMRNMAADLSFKMRQRHLSERRENNGNL